jgi:hypothetical protein
MCDTSDCRREPVVEHRFTDGGLDRHENRLCLPCYLALKLGQTVPSGDETTEWLDRGGYERFTEVTNSEGDL